MNYMDHIPADHKPESVCLVLDNKLQAVAVQSLFDPNHVRVVAVGDDLHGTEFDRVLVSDGAMRFVEGQRGMKQKVLVMWCNTLAAQAGSNVVFL